MTALIVGFLLIFACDLGYLFFDNPRQQENRHITRLARESVKRTLRGKPKRGYRHVQDEIAEGGRRPRR